MVIGGQEVLPYATSNEARQAFVDWCLAQKDNDDPSGYLVRVGLPADAHVSWCGIMLLAGLNELGLCDWEWEIGKGYLYRLRSTKFPKPGDTAYYKRNQHHACWVGDGRVVNGNGTGGRVTVTEVNPLRPPDAFFSLAPLVDKFDVDESWDEPEGAA